MARDSLAAIRTRLEKAELDHLRQHCVSLAARIDLLEGALRLAESEAAAAWDSATAWQGLAQDLRAIGAEVGISPAGDLGAIAGPSAELNSLARDAARYRWLRERDLATITKGGVFAGLTPDNLVLNSIDLDAAIDAAMAIHGAPT